MKRVKKTIAELVLKGDNAYTVNELAMLIYEIDLEDIERRHTIPVVRAMKAIENEHPQIEVWRSDMGGGKGRKMCILDITSPRARAMQRVKCWVPHYQSTAYYKPMTEADALAKLKPEDYAEGSHNYRHAMMEKARLDGNADEYDRLQAEQDAHMAALVASFKS